MKMIVRLEVREDALIFPHPLVGSSSVWYVTPFCHGDCSNMRIRPFARVHVTCDDQISRIECL
jgi:hypothetical protein